MSYIPNVCFNYWGMSSLEGRRWVVKEFPLHDQEFNLGSNKSLLLKLIDLLPQKVLFKSLFPVLLPPNLN